MIKLIKNTFYNEEETKKKLCDFIMSSDKLSMGDNVKEFEINFSKWQGRKYSVMFNSGSSANLALITSLKNLKKIEDLDRVGFSSLTWATNVMPLIQNNLSSIPLDVNDKTLNIDLYDVKEKKDLKLLFITNVLGFCSKNMASIKKYCELNNIILIEDNCESLGSEFNGIKLGNFGLASTFSFFVGHHLSTIEGGMVCTDDEILYEMLLMVREHGWTRNNTKEFSKNMQQCNCVDDFYNKYTFYYSAYNFRPTEIQGFLGNEQLKYIDKIIDKREKNFNRFNEAIKDKDKIIKLDLNHMSKISNFAFPLVFTSSIYMNRAKEIFIKNNIEIRPIIAGNITRQPFYNHTTNNLKYVNDIHSCGFYIPNNPDLTKEELEKICKVLRDEL